MTNIKQRKTQADIWKQSISPRCWQTSRWSQLERLWAAWGLNVTAAPLRSGTVTQPLLIRQRTEPATTGCKDTFWNNPFEIANKVLTRDEHGPYVWKEKFVWRRSLTTGLLFQEHTHSGWRVFCLKGHLRLLHSWCDLTTNSCLRVSKRGNLVATHW